MTTTLILDRDVGFALWLAQGLGKAGYLTFPAQSVAEAQAIADELEHEINLLVVSLALTGAADFIEMLRARNPRLKVVAVGDFHRLGREKGLSVDYNCQKPRETDESARHFMIAQIKRILSPFAEN